LVNVSKTIEPLPASASRRTNLIYAAWATLLSIFIGSADFFIVHRLWRPNSVSDYVVLGWFIGQIALLSFFVGYFLPRSIWRWVFFAWVLAMVTLFLPLLHSSVSFNGMPLLACFVGAELAFAFVWAFLGAERWTIRLTVVCMVVPPLVAYANTIGTIHQDWNALALVQTAVVAAVCLIVRLRGYRLVRASEVDGDRAFRFGMRDMLIWSLAIVPAMLLKRSGHALFETYGWASEVNALLIGLCAALTVQLALWAALGSGPWLLRLALVTLVPTALGLSIGAYFQYQYENRTGGWNRLLWITSQIGQAGWVMWLSITALVLVACLIVFRFDGCRLARHP